MVYSSTRGLMVMALLDFKEGPSKGLATPRCDTVENVCISKYSFFRLIHKKSYFFSLSC